MILHNLAIMRSILPVLLAGAAFAAVQMVAAVSADDFCMVDTSGTPWVYANLWADVCNDSFGMLYDGTEVYVIEKGPRANCGAGSFTYYWVILEDGTQGWVAGGLLNCDIERPSGGSGYLTSCPPKTIRSPWTKGCLAVYKVYK